MINTFTKQPVPPQFTDLSYNVSIDMTREYAPFFSVRSSILKDEVKVGGKGFADPFKQTRATFAKITDPKAAKDELEFLKHFNLVAEKGGSYYVNDRAKIFYDRTTGLFNGQGTKDYNVIKRLLKTYTLPGLFWKAYYARLKLPDTIELARRLDYDMLKIHEELLHLNNQDFVPPK